MKTAIRIITMITTTAGVASVNGFAGDGAIIRVDYPGTRIILDDRAMSFEGTDSIPVEPGDHDVTLYFPARGDLWMPPVISRPIHLEERQQVDITRESIRYLNIVSTPPGAEIYLDGRFLGDTPLTMSVMPTDRSLRLKKTGFQEVVIDLTGSTGLSSNLNRILEPSASLRDSTTARRKARLDERRWPLWIPYAALSGFVASTALGFYDKGRADDLYDEYLRTSSRGEMNRLFDGANRLDNRARIFWITGQLALGATVYLFIRDYRTRSLERPLPSMGIGISGDGESGYYLSLTFGGEAGPPR